MADETEVKVNEDSIAKSLAQGRILVVALCSTVGVLSAAKGYDFSDALQNEVVDKIMALLSAGGAIVALYSKLKGMQKK